MMKRFREVFRSEDGFTLIELLIVIAILGILVALAVPRMSGITDSAKTSADDANKRILESAAAMWYAQNTSYGATHWEETANATTQGANSDTDWTDYLSEWPENPQGNTSANGGSYRVVIAADGEVTITP